MLVPVRTGSAAAAGTDRLSRAEGIAPDVILLVAITIVAATIRFASITTQSYWVDESITVHEMSLSLGGLLHYVHIGETTPPLYFLIAWVWAKVFGAGELGLRSLSALLGTALIPLAYACARELVSRWAGVVAAALAAVSPFMIWYSQEARAYALFALFAGLSFLFCARAWREPSRRNLAWWSVFSVLAILTHFFAGFLVLPEAVLLLLRAPRRSTFVALGATVLAQAAMLPLAISDTSHPLGWIKAFPLSIRIRQVPVDFALGSLYQSSLVTHGLLGAAILAAVVFVLLVAGGSYRERRGAGFAAIVAAAVILVPIVLAALGRDYLVPRNLMPAWILLAVVLAAACTVPRARLAGAGLAVVLLGGFLWADVRIAANPQYQRPNWRGVAHALGRAAGARAIVAYDGGYAAQPLAVYLPGVAWQQSSRATVGVSEVDVVGSTWQVRSARLPAGTRLLSSRAVDGFRVERFLVAPAWRLPTSVIAHRATRLLGPVTAPPSVLIQRPGS